LNCPAAVQSHIRISRMVQCWLKPITYILIFSLVVRIGAAVYWQSTVPEGASCFKFGDSDTYWVHAQRIATGEPYRYLSDESRIFRAPLFPLLLAPFALYANDYGLNEIEGTVLSIRIVGSFLGTLCVGIIWWLTKRVGGRRAANVAALLAAFYPGAIGMSIFVLSEMIFCPLMLASLACSYLAIAENSRVYRKYGWVLLAGLVTGLGCLARPSWGLWGASGGFT